MDQSKLDYYFENVWEPSPLDDWEYSGIQIVDKIKPHETVIDVGCGYNLFKDKIPNLLGIDPANDAADIKIDYGVSNYCYFNCSFFSSHFIISFYFVICSIKTCSVRRC